jgi:hypothetical protein
VVVERKKAEQKRKGKDRGCKKAQGLKGWAFERR